ncbi:MAG TPA: glycosyltransferase family 39 protein [Thermoanaerobaculia bacterium]|nr:glycosyltransferase family 39 protein [Thermoanaerobaculia bacterium]
MRKLLPWLAVLLLAAAVRAPSLLAARPYMNYVDEGNYLHVSARMIGEGRWIPDTFLYPSLPTTAVAAAARAFDPFYRRMHAERSLRSDVRTKPTGYYDELEPFELLLVGRLLSFLAGLGVVLLTGLAASWIAGPGTRRQAGLLAAFTAALVPALVIRGGSAMVDPYATFFVIACLLFTERTRTANRPAWDAVAAGAMAGLAFASKYPAILVSLAFALTVGLTRDTWRERLRLWTLGAAGAIGAAILGMPGLIALPGEVLAGLRRQAELYGRLASPPLWPQVIERAEWDLPFAGPEMGWTLLGLATAGLAIGLWDRRTRSSASGWLLFILLSILLYGRQTFQPFRNLLPLVPIACIAVSVLYAKLLERTSRPLWTDTAAFLFIAALLGPPSVGFARERARFADSRTEAIDWMARRSFPGETVLVLENLAFLPSELRRLQGRNVEVLEQHELQRRLRSRRVRYLVIPEINPAIPDPYQPRARFGEERTPLKRGWWHGNRQTIHILERRRPPATQSQRQGLDRGAPARRAGGAARRSSPP